MPTCWLYSDARWQPSFGAALALRLYVAALVLPPAFLLSAYFVRGATINVDNQSLAFAAAILRFLCIVVAAVGVSIYIVVSGKAPRPAQLHAHGVVLMLLLPEVVAIGLAEVLDREHASVSGWMLFATTYFIWGTRKTLFFMLVTQKMSLLGTSSQRCLRLQFWVRLHVGFALMSAFGGVFGWLCAIYLISHGASREDVMAAAALQSDVEALSTVELRLMHVCVSTAILGAFAFSSTGFGVMYAARRLTRGAIRKLVDRNVTGELLAKVQRTLQHHLLGIIVSVVSSQVLLLATAVDGANLLGNEDIEDIFQAGATIIDNVGDVTGILLLAGILSLLFHEDPEAGDINGHIRSVLHSAVLTSRAGTVFEGRVGPTPSGVCIVSFPGKFLPEWNALTWLCEQGELSSACVFLPTSDPQHRFGKHADCPDTPGKCWCESLYGSVKPWGCLWFEHWKTNVEKAVELDLDLVAVFFPGEAGDGLVDWEDLATSDLWNGIGLGGSQKAELAYLRKRGFAVIHEDLTTTHYRITVRRITPSHKHLARCPSP